MQYIDFSQFSSLLKEYKERSEDSLILPKELSESDFIKITRVMTAKKAKDIEDIPTEEIVAIYEKISLFLSVYEQDYLLNEYFEQKLRRIKSISVQRRVL